MAPRPFTLRIKKAFVVRVVAHPDVSGVDGVLGGGEVGTIRCRKHLSGRAQPSAGRRHLPISNHGAHLQGKIHGCRLTIGNNHRLRIDQVSTLVGTKPISVRPAMGGRQTFSGVIDRDVGERCPLPWSLRKAEGDEGLRRNQNFRPPVGKSSVTALTMDSESHPRSSRPCFPPRQPLFLG
jgi:hypothetical protein